MNSNLPSPVVFLPLVNSHELAIIDFTNFYRVTKFGCIRGKDWELDDKGYPRTYGGNYLRTRKLHDFVLEPKEGFDVHHKNENVLDATHDNLEYLSRRDHVFKHIKSYKDGYVGLRFIRGKWQGCFRFGEKRIYTGTFKVEELAALVYDRAVLKFHGSGSAINFPELTDEERNTKIQELLRKEYPCQYL